MTRRWMTQEQIDAHQSRMSGVNIDAVHKKLPKKEADKQLARAEREKWERAWKLQVKAAGLPEMAEQHKFHPERQWRIDFCYAELRLGIEVEGGIWRKGGGAHSHPLNIERDIEKHNALVMLRWTVFRFTPQIITSGAGLRMVEEWIKRGVE